MATQTTHIYATHDNFPLECDVYSTGSRSSFTTEPTTVVLYFHPGGLVNGARQRIPPWLVQATVFERGWTLISPSYRLLPQIRGNELLEDSLAAYRFAQCWSGQVDANDKGQGEMKKLNRVIASGGSAGFFLATLIAHHADTFKLAPPAALLSITGITTHRHPFFKSSIQLTPQPIQYSQIEENIKGPVQVGSMHPSEKEYFSWDKLLPSGKCNAGYSTPPPAQPRAESASDKRLSRGYLYDYFLFNNQYLSIIGEDTDKGFDYLTGAKNADKLSLWPLTIFILGDADEALSPAVTTDTAAILGEERAKVFTAKGQGHLFNATWYLDSGGYVGPTETGIKEDGEEENRVKRGMEVVKQALAALDHALES